MLSLFTKQRKKKTTSKSYGNLLKHVKKYHKSIYFDKKHYGKKPVKSMAIYCELKNCIRKSFKKSSGYQCFKNCPIYSIEYLEQCHTENLGPFKCGNNYCFLKGIHEKQRSANRCKKGKIVEKKLKSDEQSFDNTGEENHAGSETRAKIRKAEIQAAAFTVSFEQPDTTTPEVNKQLTGSKDNGKFMQEKILVKQEAFNSAKIVQENDTDDTLIDNNDDVDDSLEFANLKREVELTSFKEQLAKAKLRTFRAERKSSNWRKTWMRDNQIRNNVKIKTEIIDDNCIIIELFHSSIFLTFEYLLFVHIFCYKLIYI